MPINRSTPAASIFERKVGTRRARSTPLLLVAGVLTTLTGGPAAARPATPPLISAGESIARRNCAECHALQADLASPLADAPTFPDLRRRYDRDAMVQILEARMEVIHPRMPKLRLEEDEVGEFLEYWNGLKASPRPRKAPR